MTETFKEKEILEQHADAVTFMRGLFEDGDYVCLTAIHSTRTWTGRDGNEHSEIKDCFATLKDATDAESMTLLEELNQGGWNIYVCMAPLKPDVDSREAANIAMIRHCFIEIDENGVVHAVGYTPSQLKSTVLRDPEGEYGND